MGISRTKLQAKKDAFEYARAKVSFGEGSGTRRKLIKETVISRAKNNPEYAKAFSLYLSKQDMSKHVREAKRERFAKDSFEAFSKIIDKAWSLFDLSGVSRKTFKF